MALTADRVYSVNGLKVHEFLLTKHNPNNIAMPAGNRKKTVAITIHNTDAISVSPSTTMSEQYIRATYNGAMNDVRVHYYVDDICAWQCLPDDYINWSCADGTRNANSGNNTSIAIEIIGNSQRAEENGAKLAAYLLNKYNLTVDNGLRTHTYWLNVKDGKSGTIEQLNTMHNSYKMCPYYILPHWSTFKNKVVDFMSKNKVNNSSIKVNITQTTVDELYRIRKTWDDVDSQIGAYTTLEEAEANLKSGYTIFDSNGNIIKVENKPNLLPPVDVKYRAYIGKWLNEITNCEDITDNGYAGIERYPIYCLAMSSSKGLLKYRVHILGGGWSSWISQYNINDIYHGYAGLPKVKIDAVQIELLNLDGYEVQYRVSNIKTGKYYSWVSGISDYAGVFGNPIDKIQIKIIEN